MSKPVALKIVERIGLVVGILTLLIICGRWLTGSSFWEFNSSAIPQWIMITLTMSYLFRYVELRRAWQDWQTLVELQRYTAWRAQLRPESVIPETGRTTIFDLVTREPLVTNDPKVRAQHPDLFRAEPWRYVNYPHHTAA